MSKKTYGDTLIELISNPNATIDDDVTEYRNAMQKCTVEQLYRVAHEAKSKPNYLNRDFYVVYLLKREHIGHAIHPYLFARLSCPTPHYNQSVWRYDHKADYLHYLWSLPSQYLYNEIARNPSLYLQEKESSKLAMMVMQDIDGSLLKFVKKENGEKPEALIYTNKQENEKCLIN